MAAPVYIVIMSKESSFLHPLSFVFLIVATLAAVVHIIYATEFYSAVKECETMSSAEKCIELEDIILNEVPR